MSEQLIHLHDNGNVTIPVVLRKAATELETHGHVKNKLIDDNGAMCIVGAIGKVVNGLKWGCPDVHYLGSIVHAVAAAISIEDSKRECGYIFDKKWAGVVDWNNAPERTAEEVITGLRTAADRIEAQAKG